MKKTIAAVAIMASSQSFALMLPVDNFETRTICLPKYEYTDGRVATSFCDETQNNQNARLNRKVTDSGCTTDQIILHDERIAGEAWGVQIASCGDPNIAQL